MDLPPYLPTWLTTQALPNTPHPNASLHSKTVLLTFAPTLPTPKLFFLNLPLRLLFVSLLLTTNAKRPNNRANPWLDRFLSLPSTFALVASNRKRRWKTGQRDAMGLYWPVVSAHRRRHRRMRRGAKEGWERRGRDSDGRESAGKGIDKTASCQSVIVYTGW